jgi:hypothetical protein
MMDKSCKDWSLEGNTLRVYKVDDSFILEDVHFLNAGNSIDT